MEYKEINSLMAKCIKERNNPNDTFVRPYDD